MIPVTDHLPISLRAYADAPKAKPIHTATAPSNFSLTFDCETTVDAAQALRLGAYQWRSGNRLMEAGFFYDPDGISSAELKALRSYAERESFTVRTRDEFADEVFFKRAYQLRARIIGFNLPFDISRIAVAHAPAKRAMYGGFSFTMSRQKFWPNIRVKHLSRRCALMDFSAPFRQRNSRGERNRNIRTKVRRGYFVDVSTLAASLLSQGLPLKGLSEFLKVPNPKLDFDDFDGPVSDEMLAYAMRDVQATWECYAELVKRLDKLGLDNLRPEEIYSEASIGKGYLRAMGIAPWRLSQPDFPPEMLSRILATYYGGRSEVRIRREARQVMLCDFLSMYPTVCTLMGLWRFVTADGIKKRRATVKTRQLLSRVTLSDLQAPEFWPSLTTIVRVEPDCDIFPVRAAYLGEQQATIGANYLSSDTPLWFTLADCIASKLLTGKAPKVIEAISFEPGEKQSDLRPINVNGNPDFRVDPNEADFFKRVIELRKATQARMEEADGAELAALDSVQHNLKICANSTSYGIWVQVNVAKKAKPFQASIFGHDGDSFTRKTDKAERPGEYFHPLLASLITGAARLILAMTEKLIEEGGLDWAFCDTDSMAIAKPDEMASEGFSERVKAIADWFSALNPYDFDGSILKIEKENFSLSSDELEPLYCWAVSSKRYALFNLGRDGEPILRKVSAHGLGHLVPPYTKDNPPLDIPAPPKEVLRSGVERWHCDYWFQITSAGLAGKPDMLPLDYQAALRLPAVSRYGASAPDLLRWFDSFNEGRSYRNQVKPFGFLLALRARLTSKFEEVIDPAPRIGRPPKKHEIKPVAPFDKDLEKVARTAFDRESGEAVPASSLQTYSEALVRYHLHPESKFQCGDYFDNGTTERRHIRVSGIRHIGKEANAWEQQAMLGRDSELDPDYGLAADSTVQLKADLTTLSGILGKGNAAKALRINPRKLRAIVSGRVVPDAATIRSLSGRFTMMRTQSKLLVAERRREVQCLRNMVRECGLRETARRFEIDASNLRRRLSRDN